MEKSLNRSRNSFTIYQRSIYNISGSNIFMGNIDQENFIIADKGLDFFGEEYSYQDKLMIKAPLNHQNADLLRKYFPWTAPVPVLHNNRTFGLGDRLGNATAGHIQTLKKFANITPVLAQQSVRELKLTGRTFSDVLDDVTFAVFRCGYKNGFGADGDHLKTEADIQVALDSGFTMITLDCSDHIKNDVFSMSDAQIDEIYVPDAIQENIYLNKKIKIKNNANFSFSEIEFKRMTLIYNQAIRFAQKIFEKYISKFSPTPEFEISIDETLFPTAPNQHYFVANELFRHGIKVSSLAPRFYGEFQKGIEYIGDISRFEKEFKVHALIADHFGYKISVHSGSDKFSVYPIVERLTNGRFHIKTSGTSWLEAMRSIAVIDKELFREIHKYALSAHKEALRYYHVTSDFTKIPDVNHIPDEKLPDLFNHEIERQLIHICYGLILNYMDAGENFVFRNRLFKIWKEEEELYFDNLDKQISRHLSLIS